MTLVRLEARRYRIKLGWPHWIMLAPLVALIAVMLTSWLAERFQEIAGNAVMTPSVDRMPTVEAALVLGTSKLMPDGRLNLIFKHRLDAAAALWKAGKARYLIASGNHTGAYDEPSDMRDGLIARGVPADAVYRDGRGFRTWDSVVRARAVFGLQRLAIVSQRAHVARAIFIARSLGLQAYGLEARDEEGLPLETRMHAYLAAVLSYYDIWRGRPPRPLGPRIALGVDPAK